MEFQCLLLPGVVLRFLPLHVAGCILAFLQFDADQGLALNSILAFFRDQFLCTLWWDLNLVLYCINLHLNPIWGCIFLVLLTQNATFLVAITSICKVLVLATHSCKQLFLVLHCDKVLLQSQMFFLTNVVPSFYLNQGIVLPLFVLSLMWTVAIWQLYFLSVLPEGPRKGSHSFQIYNLLMNPSANFLNL